MSKMLFFIPGAFFYEDSAKQKCFAEFWVFKENGVIDDLYEKNEKNNM